GVEATSGHATAEALRLSDASHHLDVQATLDAELKSDAPTREEDATKDADTSRIGKEFHDSRASSGATDDTGRGGVQDTQTRVDSDVKDASSVLQRGESD